MRRRDHGDRARRSGGFVDARLEAAGRAVEVADAGRVMRFIAWPPTKSPTSAAKAAARVTMPMCPVPSSRATVGARHAATILPRALRRHEPIEAVVAGDEQRRRRSRAARPPRRRRRAPSWIRVAARGADIGAQRDVPQHLRRLKRRRSPHDGKTLRSSGSTRPGAPARTPAATAAAPPASAPARRQREPRARRRGEHQRANPLRMPGRVVQRDAAAERHADQHHGIGPSARHASSSRSRSPAYDAPAAARPARRRGNTWRRGTGAPARRRVGVIHSQRPCMPGTSTSGGPSPRSPCAAISCAAACRYRACA